MSELDCQRMADEAVDLILKGIEIRPDLIGDLTKRVGAEEALERERAARSAGKGRKYPWGNGDPCTHAVISGCGQNNQATARVCSRPSGNTEQGLCDMAGNAWECVG